jgi:nitrite reductase/ring-hydroxylating ferredoxin subunit
MSETVPNDLTAMIGGSTGKTTSVDGAKIVGLPMPQSIELVRDPSTRPVVQLRSKRRFPFPVPNGWFIVARGDELAPGAKVNRHYFGHDLVAFRTESGQARVVDAYCAHLGAHMGVGGVVQGESLKCPFHGWRYDGQSGQCVEIPYAPEARIPKLARVRAYPTVERNRMIWAWHHLEGKPPFFEVPEVFELTSPDWTEPYYTDFPLRTSCQEMAENNHDAAHFQFVHGTPDIPQDEITIEGHYKRVVARKGAFVRETFGLGLGVLRIKDLLTFISSVSPIDEENVHVRWTFASPKSVGEAVMKQVADSFLAGVSQDIPIWENKVYRERPVLTKGEGTIADHRKWSQQFYSDPTKAVDFAPAPSAEP